MSKPLHAHLPKWKKLFNFASYALKCKTKSNQGEPGNVYLNALLQANYKINFLFDMGNIFYFPSQTILIELFCIIIIFVAKLSNIVKLENVRFGKERLLSMVAFMLLSNNSSVYL